MPYDAVRSQTHRKGRRDLLCLTGSPVRKAEALRIGAKASNQASRLPSERPRIFPNLSGKVPLWRGKINIPGSEVFTTSRGGSNKRCERSSLGYTAPSDDRSAQASIPVHVQPNICCPTAQSIQPSSEESSDALASASPLVWIDLRSSRLSTFITLSIRPYSFASSALIQ